MNYDPNQFPPDSQDPNGFSQFDPNAFGEGGEMVAIPQRKKEPYWKRIGGGSLTLSLLVHVILILIALFLIKFVVDTKKPEAVDFLPGGGGGGKSSEAKMATKRKQVSMNQPKSRIAANVTSSTVTLPDVQTMSSDTSISGFALPSGGVGGGEGGLKGSGKGGLQGSGMGKGMGAGSGLGFVANLPPTMRSRCSPQDRAKKMQENGGSQECEVAVVKALDWLKSKQNADGSWGRTFKGAMTGMSLLAYYGHCETPDSPYYGENVMKGITYLVDLSGKTQGFFTENLGNTHCVYEHGIGCYALGETYSFSKMGTRQLPGLREAFEKGVKIILDNQTADGGWAYGQGSSHYLPTRGGEMSVTGWQFQALKAAQHTNLKIAGLPKAVKQVSNFLEGQQTPDGGIGANTPRGSAYSQYTMTGIGALGLQTLSGGSTAIANKGLRFLEDQYSKDPLDWKKNANLYCWYYNTQAFFQKGGKDWEDWNAQCRTQLLKNQKPDGSYNQETGDFAIATSGGAGADAEIYRTCLCTLMLEVYYRFLKVGNRDE